MTRNTIPIVGLRRLALVLVALSPFVISPALAQTCDLSGTPSTTLRDPLIYGAPVTAPFLVAPAGQPAPTGDGITPLPTVPGMCGDPTLLPWVPVIPSNQIDQPTSLVPLPVTPAAATPAGVLGPALTGFVPEPPSTPGADPGNLTAPMGSFNPAANVLVQPCGGIPGRGGYCTSIPVQRRGGQKTHQWELRGRNSTLGGLPDDGSQDEVELLGPNAGYGVPYGVPTGDGLRNSSIDLGGGMRVNPPGTSSTVSMGSTVQDYGLSSTRNNPIPALNARQSTEFGQGWRRIPQYSSKTTDFGLPYTQFSPANENPQKRGQMMVPTAVITNF